MKFKNRKQAAQLLANELRHYTGTEGVVLALPRGGVPLAYPIAQELAMPMDILLIKKIGHPRHPEYAIGAVSLQGSLVNEDADIDPAYFDREIVRIREQLRQRYRLFKGEQVPHELKGKNVILVDDGIATGYTIKAAAQLVNKHQPSRVIIAAPVAPRDTVRELQDWADEVVVLSAPSDFGSVGQFYEDFSEVSDEEVVQLIHEAGK